MFNSMNNFSKALSTIIKVFFITVIITVIYFLFDSTKPFHYGKSDNHFDGKKFHNYNPIEGTFTLSDIGKWQFYEFRDDIKKLWPEFLDDFKYNKETIEPSVPNGTIKITFINHATFLIQVNNINILTDPLFAKRASPFNWIGPKRYRKPGIVLEDLPKIDYIVISHDHYDHCDIKAIKILQQKFNTTVIAGLGMKSFLKSFGIICQDLDWWENVEDKINMVNINFVPAIHWSGRYGLLGNNRTLWGGYVISSSAGNIYFSGDTAYGTGNVFNMIKEKFRNFKYAILPIGAYEPRWFMKVHHINPEEAVSIHKVIDPEHSIAAHFGCLALSMEGEGTPEEDLISSLRRNHISTAKFLILKHGESSRKSSKIFIGIN
jgi:L-ascorbate metabolism protein UlaG (beta-lactamase superfamily)